MAFKQRLKSHLKEGNQVKVIFGGMEYEGKVIEYENLNPPDAHVTLETDDGTQYILPVGSQMVAVIPPPIEQDELEPEDEPEDEKKKVTSKAPAKKK